MRAIALGILIAMLALVLIAFAPKPPEAGSGAAGEEFSLSFRKPFFATYGGEPAAIAMADARGADGAEIYADLSEKPFLRQVYWLSGIAAGASGAAGVREALDKQISPAGVKTDDWGGQFGGGRFALVAASGAFPKALSEKFKNGEFPQNGQMLVFIGRADGSTIGGGGEFEKDTQLGAELGKAVMDAEGGFLRMHAKAGGEVMVFPKMPDEYGPELLARAIAGETVFAPDGSAHAQARLRDGRNTLVVPAGKDESYLRLFARSNGTAVKAAYFGPMQKLDGEISGPSEAAAGEARTFSVFAGLGFAENESLSLYLLEFSGNGTPLSRKLVARAEAKEAWAGAVKAGGIAGVEDEILQLEDQYGRQYARAYVRLPRLEAKLVGGSGQEKEFAITKDGEAAEGSSILVRKPGGEWAEAAMSGGKVFVSSKWEGGRNEVEFSLGGITDKVGWEEGGNGIYLRYGVPGLAFAIALYLALKPKEKPKYRIRHGSPFRPLGVKKMELAEFLRDLEEWQRAVGRPLGIAEINRRIMERHGFAAPEESLERELSRLCGKGKLVSFSGEYGSAAACTPEKARVASISSRLADTLLQQGIETKAQEGGLLVPKNGGGEAWQVFCRGKEPPLRKFSKTTLVFNDGGELAEFRRWLCGGSMEASRARVAMECGKLATLALGK